MEPLETQPPLFIDLPDIPFTSDGLYEFSSDNIEVSDPGDIDFGTMELNDEMSGAINIVDTIYEAWHFWQDNDGNDNRTEYDEVDLYWSQDGGYGSYYVGVLDNLYIKGDPDPDESTIRSLSTSGRTSPMTSGAATAILAATTLVLVLWTPNLLLARATLTSTKVWYVGRWAKPQSNFYVDLNALGSCSVCIDLENWPGTHTADVHVNNELSNAAALLDLVNSQ